MASKVRTLARGAGGGGDGRSVCMSEIKVLQVALIGWFYCPHTLAYIVWQLFSMVCHPISDKLISIWCIFLYSSLSLSLSLPPPPKKKKKKKTKNKQKHAHRIPPQPSHPHVYTLCPSPLPSHYFSWSLPHPSPPIFLSPSSHLIIHCFRLHDSQIRSGQQIFKVQGHLFHTIHFRL